MSHNEFLKKSIDKNYKLPITGKVRNWKNFSGESSDPVRVIGVEEFLDIIEWEKNDKEMRRVRVKVLKFNIDEGLADVKIIANIQFHQKFSKWLEENSPEDICRMSGKRQLKFLSSPEHINDQKPEEEFTKIW